MVKVLLLGCGTIGSIITRVLNEMPEVSEVLVADREYERTREYVESLGSEKLSVAKVDVRDVDACAELMKEADVVCNATWYLFNLYVMRAAIKAKRDVLDLGGLYHMTLEQLKLDDEVKEAGITTVIGCGSDPGLSNVMARYCADRLDEVEGIHIRYGGIGGGAFYFAIPTIINEFTMEAVVFRDGKYVRLPPLSEEEIVEFPEPVGKQTTYCIIHSELATLPKTIKGVKNVDYKDSWGEETINVLKVLKEYGFLSEEPVEVEGVKVAPRSLVIKLLSRAIPKVTPGSVDVLRVIAKGVKDGLKTTITCDAIVRWGGKCVEWNVSTSNYITAVPAAVGTLLLGRGEVKEKGVVPPEVAFDAEKFLEMVSEWGVEIYEKVEQIKPVGKS